MEIWRLIKFFPEFTGRLRGDAGSMWQGGDGKVRGTSGGCQRHHRT